MTDPRLSADQRRALAMLAVSGHDGAMRSLLIAKGFGVVMINALVSQELATLTYEKAQFGCTLSQLLPARCEMGYSMRPQRMSLAN